MTLDSNKTVRELALEIPSATRVFEKLGIDYCCGGGKKLTEACDRAKLPVEQVFRELEQAEASRADRLDNATNWNSAPLADLIDHIVQTHHVYLRNELPRLMNLAEKVSGKHGETHPETQLVNQVVSDLANELMMHLMKEEQILFPYIVRMEESKIEKSPVVPSSCFGTVQNPIQMMEMEHDSAGDALRQLRAATSDYKAPQDACTSFRALYTGLLELEADLHQHIHMENNILHPRAIAMENGR
jgi:regulator of cell morphogenesis and NO signaling